MPKTVTGFLTAAVLGMVAGALAYVFTQGSVDLQRSSEETLRPVPGAP